MDVKCQDLDPAEFAQLPDGGWIPRKAAPCPDCGPAHAADPWEVVRVTKTFEFEGETRRTVSTSVQCPRLYEHKRQERPRNLVVLGHFDVLTGELALFGPDIRES